MADSRPIWIEYCGVPQCKLCRSQQLDLDSSFFSNLSKQQFHCHFKQNCKTSYVIYIISCKQDDCSCKYVGRTACALNRRLSLHRGNIIAGTEGPAMVYHFTKVHQPSDMKIKAIEICSSSNIKERESYWIAELNTAFPYGLNDRVGRLDTYSHTMDNVSTNRSIYELFNKVTSKRTCKGGRKRNKNITSGDSAFNPEQFMESIFQPSQSDKLFFINFVRNKIMSLNKADSKLLFLHLTVCINEHNEAFHRYSTCACSQQLPYLARDIVFAKIKTTFSPKVSQHYLVVNYCNKFIDMLQLNKIINKKQIRYLFPNVSNDEMKTPKITYKYSNTIRS